MAYRNLMIASNAQLKIKNEQLLIKTVFLLRILIPYSSKIIRAR